MLKDEAIEILGGTAASAADLMGVTYQAVKKWPQRLPLRISDRVLGVCVRKRLQIPARFIESNSATERASKAQAAINSEARQAAREVV